MVNKLSVGPTSDTAPSAAVARRVPHVQDDVGDGVVVELAEACGQGQRLGRDAAGALEGHAPLVLEVELKLAGVVEAARHSHGGDGYVGDVEAPVASRPSGRVVTVCLLNVVAFVLGRRVGAVLVHSRPQGAVDRGIEPDDAWHGDDTDFILRASWSGRSTSKMTSGKSNSHEPGSRNEMSASGLVCRSDTYLSISKP